MSFIQIVHIIGYPAGTSQDPPAPVAELLEVKK
jgi:hypothetical protein